MTDNNMQTVPFLERAVALGERVIYKGEECEVVEVNDDGSFQVVAKNQSGELIGGARFDAQSLAASLNRRHQPCRENAACECDACDNATAVMAARVDLLRTMGSAERRAAIAILTTYEVDRHHARVSYDGSLDSDVAWLPQVSGWRRMFQQLAGMGMLHWSEMGYDVHFASTHAGGVAAQTLLMDDGVPAGASG